jgi:hypothetical protein
MQNFDDIKSIYQKASEPPLPSAKEILLQVESSRKKMMRKNILVALLLAFTFVFISVIAYYYDSKIWTTTAGIVLTLISIILGIIFNSQLVRLLMKQSDPTLDNNAYLHQLVQFREKQRLIQTTGITLYFILLTSGIMLYMYEFAMRNLMFGLISYSLTLAWIAFNWFYLRKKAIIKQEKLINDQVKALEDLINHIKN